VIESDLRRYSRQVVLCGSVLLTLRVTAVPGAGPDRAPGDERGGDTGRGHIERLGRHGSAGLGGAGATRRRPAVREARG
jgi:hypothetical protein